jgi:hypothetical protein
MAYEGGTIDFSSETDKLANWEVYLLEFERYSTTLSASASDTATAISGDDVTDFPNQGDLLNGSEIIEYDNKTGTAPGCFEVSLRGAFQTVAVSAASGGTIREPFDKYWGSKIGILPGDLDGISDDRAVLGMPQGIKASIIPDEGKSSIGNISVTLDNKDNIISKMLSIVPMKNRKATLWAGYENLHADEYEKEYVGLIKSWVLENDFNRYRVTISDLRRSYRQGLFTQVGKTRLNGTIDNVVTTIPVDNTAGVSGGDVAFTDPADSYDIDTYLKVEDEIMGPVTAMSATGFTVTTRGVFGTVADSHADDSDVDELIIFDSRNPIDMILQLLMSTGDGTNGDYDDLPSHCGFGIDEDLIDVTTFETERDDWTASYTIGFVINDTQTDGKSWIEKELLRLVGGYIVALRNGTLSLRMYHRQALADERSIDQDDIISIRRYDPRHTDILNWMLVRYSKNPGDGVYRELYEHINADSASKHGFSPLAEVSFDGVHDDKSLFDPTLDGLNLLADYTNRITVRYANEAPALKVQVSSNHRDLNEGDLIALTHPDLPNFNPDTSELLTGLGITTEEYEIVSRMMKYSGEKQYVEFDLLRAIFAPGSTLYLDYFYKQYLRNGFLNFWFSRPGFTPRGAGQYWNSNNFVLTANIVRLRAQLSKGAAIPVTGNVSGVLVCTDTTVVVSDTIIAASALPTWPDFSWFTFEFTPGAAAGKTLQWLGLEKTGAGLGHWGIFDHSAGGGDQDEDSNAGLYLSTRDVWDIDYEFRDVTADIAEKLI